MTRALLVLDTTGIREKAKRWIDQAPAGTRVEYKAPKRSLEQNALMWALLTEVAEQVAHHGIKLGADDWKLIFLDALKREVRMVPNLDGNGFVNLGRSTSDLSKDEMTDMIELIMAFGAKHELVFKTKTTGEPSQALPDTDDEGSASMPESSDDEVAGVMSPPAPATSDTTDAAWLKTAARMLWGATNWKGDTKANLNLLNNQRLAVDDLDESKSVSQRAKARAGSIYRTCKSAVMQEVDPTDALKMVAGLAGTTEAVIMGKEEA